MAFLWMHFWAFFCVDFDVTVTVIAGPGFEPLLTLQPDLHKNSVNDFYLLWLNKSAKFQSLMTLNCSLVQPYLPTYLPTYLPSACLPHWPIDSKLTFPDWSTKRQTPVKDQIILGREPWSSGYGRFQRLWVQIPAPYTGWKCRFLHWFVFKIVLFVWKDQK